MYCVLVNGLMDGALQTTASCKFRNKIKLRNRKSQLKMTGSHVDLKPSCGVTMVKEQVIDTNTFFVKATK